MQGARAVLTPLAAEDSSPIIEEARLHLFRRGTPVDENKLPPFEIGLHTVVIQPEAEIRRPGNLPIPFEHCEFFHGSKAPFRPVKSGHILLVQIAVHRKTPPANFEGIVTSRRRKIKKSAAVLTSVLQLAKIPFRHRRVSVSAALFGANISGKG
jgi:hypothetical protein